MPADQVTGVQRASVKQMNYGLAYGLSAYGLSTRLGVSVAEARELMDDYFTTSGGVRDYLNDVVAQARRTGFTETLAGRRRYLPDLISSNRQRREMAERMEKHRADPGIGGRHHQDRHDRAGHRLDVVRPEITGVAADSR